MWMRANKVGGEKKMPLEEIIRYKPIYKPIRKMEPQASLKRSYSRT